MTITAAVFQPLLDMLTANTGDDARERWPEGPTVRRKSRTGVPIATYLGALRAAEDAYSTATAAEFHQRLRRLHYSAPVGAPKFDDVLRNNSAWNSDRDRPLIVKAGLSRESLNVLYGTDSVITPSGRELDPSHLFPALDLRDNGLGLRAGSFAMSSVPWMGLLTWLGDLASWWIEWETRREQREVAGVRMTDVERIALLLETFAVRVDKADLLGDMDAVIVAANLPAGTRLSDYLQRYYAAETDPAAAAASTPNARNRFQYFLLAAPQQLRFQIQNAAPLRVRFDATASRPLLFTSMRRVIELLETGPIDESDIDRNAGIISAILDRFLAFLAKGLATGDSAWPTP